MSKPDPEFIKTGEAMTMLIRRGFKVTAKPGRIVADKPGTRMTFTIHEGGWIDGRRIKSL